MKSGMWGDGRVWVFLIPVAEENNDEFYRDTECKTTWTAKIPADNSRMHTAPETAQTYENGNGTTCCQHNTANLSPYKIRFWTDKDSAAKAEIC
jgi:hypothetical protein